MISRPVTRCPLWQRRLCATSDATWIAEDPFSKASQRLSFLSKLSRRSASSVPGPMESRRRLGKRRLGNLSEASQWPAQHVGSIWDIFENVGQSQWQWEPPSKTQERNTKNTSLQLPAWLGGYEALPEEKQATTYEKEMPSSTAHLMPSAIAETDVRQFREAIKSDLPHRIATLCESFNHRYQQNIMLGLVSGDDLTANLRDFTADIREVTTDKVLITSRCLSLYSAAWEGIKACKVLGPFDLEGKVLDGLLLLLADLPSLEAVQTLATDIVNTASSGQVEDMEQSVLAIVKMWLSSWCHLAKNDAKHNRKEMISSDSALNTTLANSARRLTKFFGLLPVHMALGMISTSTDYVTSPCFGAIHGPVGTFRKLRYSWMSVVANTSGIDEESLVKIWLTMNLLQTGSEKHISAVSTICRLKLHESCRLLLDFWISHGHLKAPEDVRATFYASILTSNRADDVGYLLQAIIKHREGFAAKLRSLLRIMRRVARPQAIYEILMVLRNADIRIPTSLLRLEIKEMTQIDARWAWNLCKLYHQTRYDATPLPLEKFPELVVAMIKSPDFHPNDIWNGLGMLPSDQQWLRSSSKALAQSRSSLIHRMALAFAQAEFLSPRVAFRNVTLCARYLRLHRIPLTPELSRALTHTGVIRDLLRQRWLGTERMTYILDLVRDVEGLEVSARMDTVLYTCQRELAHRQKEAMRAANPLRLPRDNWC